MEIHFAVGGFSEGRKLFRNPCVSIGRPDALVASGAVSRNQCLAQSAQQIHVIVSVLMPTVLGFLVKSFVSASPPS